MMQRTELQRQVGQCSATITCDWWRPRISCCRNWISSDDIGCEGSATIWREAARRLAARIKDFYSFDHQEMEIGFEMGLVVGRRQARAAVRNATWNSHANKPSCGNNNAVSRIKSATQSQKCRQASTPCKVRHAQGRAARERLESSESLYRADKLQIEFLLDAQEELARIELQYAADQSRYALSLVNIHDVTGQLLAESGIYISAAGCQVGRRFPSPLRHQSFRHCFALATAAKSPQRLPALQ